MKVDGYQHSSIRKWVIFHEASKVDILWVLMAMLALEGRAYRNSVILQLWAGLERTLNNSISLLKGELSLQTQPPSVA